SRGRLSTRMQCHRRALARPPARSGSHRSARLEGGAGASSSGRKAARHYRGLRDTNRASARTNAPGQASNPWVPYYRREPMPSLDDFARRKLGALERANLHRIPVPTDRLDGLWVVRGGRRLLSFSCNDYLNLSHHPGVKAAAIEALSRYGTGAGASRLVTGNH